MSYITPYHYSSIYQSSLQRSPDIQKITNILHHSLHTELIQALAVRFFSTLIAVTQIQNLHGIITRRKDERLIATINQSYQPLKNFNLSKDNLKRIMPYLEYADFRDCSVINEFTNEEFQELLDSSQNLKQLFISSNHIQSLKIPETVTELNCYHCERLTSLDLFNCTGLKYLNLSNCTGLIDLDCANCPELKYLDLPNCTGLTFLNLSNCTGLTNLDCANCPQLTDLNLSNCTGLTTLNCANCPQLKYLDLPNCTGLTTLDCANCPQLIYLYLPNCTGLTTLNCSFCTALTTLDCSECSQLSYLNLSDCENLRTLECSRCPQLTTLNVERLPQCRVLQCINTPFLILPILPRTTRVSGYDFYNLTVDLAKLEQNATSILLQLGCNYLLRGHSFPRITFTDSRLEPGDSPGVDAGGLQRHFVSTLFENLVQNEEFFTGDPKNKLPVFPSANQEPYRKEYFRTIGRLFALCFDSSLLTGEHFDENLFTTILWIINNSNPRPYPFEEFEERVYCQLRGIKYDDFRTFSEEDRRSYITETPTVYPAILIAEEMKAALQQRALPEGLEFQRAIQGIGITSEKLLDKVTFNQQSNMQRFFRNWVREAQPEQLVEFVKFATGDQTLGDKKITIELFYYRSPEDLPLSHTCNKTLEMPIYPDQKTFNEKINKALEFGGAKGFQFI